MCHEKIVSGDFEGGYVHSIDRPNSPKGWRYMICCSCWSGKSDQELLKVIKETK